MTQIKTPAQARQKAREWAGRLEALYSRIELWMRELFPEATFTRSQTPKSINQEFPDAGRGTLYLPALTAEFDDQTIRFYPSALRIVGARGRVDVFQGSSYLFQLIDSPQLEGMDDEWMIVGKHGSDNLVRLTKSSFEKYGNFRKLNRH